MLALYTYYCLVERIRNTVMKSTKKSSRGPYKITPGVIEGKPTVNGNRTWDEA